MQHEPTRTARELPPHMLKCEHTNTKIHTDTYTDMHVAGVINARGWVISARYLGRSLCRWHDCPASAKPHRGSCRAPFGCQWVTNVLLIMMAMAREATILKEMSKGGAEAGP